MASAERLVQGHTAGSAAAAAAAAVGTDAPATAYPAAAAAPTDGWCAARSAAQWRSLELPPAGPRSFREQTLTKQLHCRRNSKRNLSRSPHPSVKLCQNQMLLPRHFPHREPRQTRNEKTHATEATLCASKVRARCTADPVEGWPA